MTPRVAWPRRFAVLWAGQLVALTCVDLATFAVSVSALEHLYDTPVLLVATVVGPVVAFVLCSPAAGALVDRTGPRRALLAANALTAANLLLLGLLLATGALDPVAIWFYLLVGSALKALHLAAYEAAVPLLVPKRHLGRANGGRMLLTGLAGVVGIVTAHPLLDSPGLVVVLLVCGATTLVPVLTVLALRVPRVDPGPAPAGRTGLLAEAAEAWRYVIARPGMPVLLAVLALVNIGIGCSEQLLPSLVLAFGSEADVTTDLLAGFAGLVAGTLVMAVWGGPQRLGRGIVVSVLLFAGAMVAGALRPSTWLVAASAFVFLGATPVVVGTVQTLLQRKVEPRLLGRTAAIKNAVMDVPYTASALAAGLVVIPAVGGDDIPSAVVDAAVGDGPGRGYAVALLAVGLAVGACALAATRRPGLRELEQRPDVTLEDLAARTPVPPSTRPAG
jgi:MFS family permease